MVCSFFYKNGSNELFVTTGGGDLEGNERTNVLSATLNLSVGDYIEVYLRVNTSGTASYNVGNTYNRFSGHRLIGYNMGTIKTTNIEPIADNGTVTLGSSGDTFTLGSGVKAK